MDPFDEVKEDAWQQVERLEGFVTSTSPHHETKLDFENALQELQETIGDLRQAVAISEGNPDQFQLTTSGINARKEIIRLLNGRMEKIEGQWREKEGSTAGDRTQSTNNPQQPAKTHPQKQREITTMSNRISQDHTQGENPFDDRFEEDFNAFQQQEVLQNQDLQLDLIHQTMRNLNQQAAMMGSELEDQGMMLDDLDQEMDVVGSKLQRGLKRVGFVIEKNKERASDWCIGILVVALCVLLVIVIAI